MIQPERKVLIVDDEEAVRRLLSRKVSRMGCFCATASDGDEGLALLKEGNFDVAIIDMKMPKMGGLALLSAISESGIDTVPIVLTGYGEPSDAFEAAQRGAFEFIEKPCQPEFLVRTIERAIEYLDLLQRSKKMEALAEQWETTFDASPNPTIVLDLQHRILRCNLATLQRLETTREEVLGRHCHEALCRGEHSLEDCPFDSSAEGGQPSSECCLWGREYSINQAPLKDRKGQAWGRVYITHDITERKQAESESARLAAVIEQLNEISIITDLEGTMEYVNPAFEAITGYTCAEAVGENLRILKCDRHDAEFFRDMWDTLRGGELWRGRITNKKKDGTLYESDVSISPIRDESGVTTNFISIQRDITHELTLAAQLAQAQKLESIGQLAAGIAHEINTPTQYVGDNTHFLQSTFSDLLGLLDKYGQLHVAATENTLTPELLAGVEAALEEADLEYLTGEIPKAIQQSLDGIERIAKIVRAMKEFSHPGGQEKEGIDLNRAIETTITVARNEWKYAAEVEMTLDDALPPVPCLPGEFNQVILNLIVNAAHAIEAVGDEELGKISVTTRQNGNWAEIRIHDTGCGIPEDAQERIFDPFFTTKEVGKGTGQGLAIAHSVITDKHNGTIDFRSSKEEGTTFIIRLPIDS